MGNSATKELEDTKSRLAASQQQIAALAKEKGDLDQQVKAQSQTLAQQEKALLESDETCRQQLQLKDDALAKALKQQQLAEGLRRSDALLAKRLLHSQLRHLGGAAPAIGGVQLDGSMAAAAAALSAYDELQLREVRASARSSPARRRRRSRAMRLAAKPFASDASRVSVRRC